LAVLGELAGHPGGVGREVAGVRVEVGGQGVGVEQLRRQPEQFPLPGERECAAVADEPAPQFRRRGVENVHTAQTAGDELDEPVALGGVQQALSPLGEPGIQVEGHRSGFRGARRAGRDHHTPGPASLPRKEA
jgi:hypothetical protein